MFMKRLLPSGFAMLAVLVSMAAGDDALPNFKIATQRETDSVEARGEGGGIVFVVKSPNGIGQATVERTDSSWPETAGIRLHLKGLEKFTVSAGKVALHAAVSSHDGSVRVWRGDDEGTSLDGKSPYWMDIRAISREGKPTKAVPLNGGHFELVVPKALFEHDPKTIEFQWIDFYRN